MQTLSLMGVASGALLWIVTPVVAQQAPVRLEDHPDQSSLSVMIGPIDLPSTAEHHHDAGATEPPGEHHAVYPPIGTVTFPASMHLFGFSYDVVDSAGHQLPRDLVHHINFIDPDHRELFLPISQRLAAVGKETGSQALPWMLFGVPVTAGQRMVVSAMLHNPTGTDYPGAIVRFRFDYVRGGRPWPFFRVYPFQLDVAFPAGDKSFDLPPGRSSKSYEARPAMPGRLLGIGGHLHEYATSLRFEDVTTKEVIWEGKPVADKDGNVERMPVGRLYKKLGVKIFPDHLYRVTVDYDNPWSTVLPGGGMGVVGGVFMASGSDPWPAADTTDQTYSLDRKHYMREVHGDLAAITGQGAPAEPADSSHHHH